MTPQSLSSDFQFPFKDEWLTPMDRQDRREYLTHMDEREKGPGESEDPALHPEWDERLKQVDRKCMRGLRSTDDLNEFFCEAAWLKQ